MAAKMILMGRIGQAPEIKWVQGHNGDFCTARYSVAVQRKSGNNDVTDWFTVKAIGKTAEFVDKYLKKGMKIYVEGTPQVDVWEKDGKKTSMVYLFAEKHEFCESKGASDGTTINHPDPMTDPDGFANIPDGIDEELPFV